MIVLSSPHRRGSIRKWTPAPRAEVTLYFFFNLALLIAFSLFAFSYNPGRLFIGNDGPMLLSLAKEQLEFFGPSPNLHTNLLQGIGNLSFPINLSFMPGFWLPFTDAAGNFIPAPIYTWFAALMFITVLLVGWNYRFPRGTTYAAAWLLTLLMFPYFEKYMAIYAVTASSPLFIWYMFAVAVADIGMQRMGTGRWRASVFYACILLLGIFLMIAASPAAVILMAPFLCVSFAVSFLQAPREVRIRKLGMAGVVLLICGALGWVEYAAGLLLYSSSGFFFQELAESYSASREFASILFQGHIADRAFGPFLFVLASIGAYRALAKKNPTLKKPALIMLAGQILHAGIAAQLLAWSEGWTGPPPIYTEMTFFALYALFAVSFIAGLLRRTYHPYCLPTLTAVLLTCFLLTRPAMKERNLLQSFAMPPAASPITDILEKEIALTPGSPFRGRVATVLPSGVRGQTLYSYRYNIALENDHMTDGLWLKNIPTLTEYNQLITPAFYRITRDFLSLPNDQQNRSWTNFSYIDERILRMLGVRFLLSTDAVRDNATHLVTLEIPGVRALHLFELKDTNTQGVSANTIITVDSLDKAMEALKQQAFGAHSAVVFSDVGTLVPVTTNSITIERGGYHIRAQSTGRSMLIIPVEYSHCLHMTTVSGKALQAVRINIALTGLVFERELDILLTNRIGPFHTPRCRLADYREFKMLVKE